MAYYKNTNSPAPFIVFGSIILLFLASLVGWCVHVITCILDAHWLLLIAGAIAAPVGVIHGWGIIFGIWH